MRKPKVSVATISELRAAAIKAGGSLIKESSGRWIVYQIEAPAGKVWVDGHASSLRVEWISGQGDHRSIAICDALSRIECGLTNAALGDD